MIRKWIGMLLAFCLCIGLAAPAGAAGTVKGYAQQLLQYYRHYQDEAEDVIWDILNHMAQVDPNQAAVWENIMDDWAWVNEEMPIGQGVLPDGLPEDDSLCIVVLGYQLSESGGMQEELVDRLVVALASAIKYPNAWIAVTGGQTSQVKGATEAGRMANWLRHKGVDPERIIVDTKALSTTANMQNVYSILNRDYPQVDSVAVVTSDYHVTWGSALFAAQSNHSFGYEAGNPIDVVGAAVCETGKTLDSMSYQVWGISEITGVAYRESDAPELYWVDRPTEPETTPVLQEEEAVQTTPTLEVFPAQEAQEEVPSEQKDRNWWPCLLLLAIVAYVLTPKKPRKKRKRPEWKWE